MKCDTCTNTMKCDTCTHAADCMNFFCNDDTSYKDYESRPCEAWQIEDIRVPYNVIIPEVK